MRVTIAVASVLAVSTAVSAAESSVANGFTPPPVDVGVCRVCVPAARTLLCSSSSSIPSRWDSRDNGWISSVKNQGAVGSCWTFAAYATLEAQMLKRGSGEHDFSEKNMVNLSGFDMAIDDGGNSDMAAAYLLRWGGAVAESNDVYVTSMGAWTPSPSLKPAVRVQNAVWIPSLNGSGESMDGLKSAIMEYGAVATAVAWCSGTGYCTSNMYYNSDNTELNHAVTVVGWDDEIPASAFATKPSVDGAWLIKNSWGVYRGDAGYYWISYDDVSFATIKGTVFIPAAEGENYDVVRGYDKLGYIDDLLYYYYYYWDWFGYDYQASVFTSTRNEELAAVGLYTTIYPNPYTIYVYTNVTKGASSPVEGGVLAYSFSGTLATPGFTTIPLPQSLELPDTNSFAIVYQQPRNYIRSTAATFSLDGYATPTQRRGDCYLGFVDSGTNAWYDAYDEGLNYYGNPVTLCIKAYTRLTSTETGGVPREPDDGSAMMAELASENWPWFFETGETFGAAAKLFGANGRSIWSSWLIGLDWSDPKDTDIRVFIEMIGGKPFISYSPDLGSDRTYTLYGRKSLDASEGWSVVDSSDPGATGAKFFKVTIGR